MGVADGTGARLRAGHLSLGILASFTPLLFGRSTVPLLVWTYSVIPVYSYGSGRFTGRVDRAERADADRIRRRFAVNGSLWRLSARGTPIPKPSYQN